MASEIYFLKLSLSLSLSLFVLVSTIIVHSSNQWDGAAWLGPTLSTPFVLRQPLGQFAKYEVCTLETMIG